VGAAFTRAGPRHSGLQPAPPPLAFVPTSVLDAGHENLLGRIAMNLRRLSTILCATAGALLVGGAMLAGGIQQSSAQSKYAWPKFFNVITPAVGTANHSLALAWTPEFSNATGSRARVLP